jgi:hypothetical protein
MTPQDISLLPTVLTCINTLPLEIQTAKKHEHTKVLLILAESYKIDANEYMHSEILREKMQLEPLYLRILVTY